MRTEPFKNEFRKIRLGIYHAFHGHMGAERTRHATPGRTAQRRVLDLPLTILDIMRKRPITVRPESSLVDALALMSENGISAVPVVTNDGRLVGELSETDLLKIFYEPDATEVASVMTRDPVVLPVDAPLVDLVDQLMSSDLRRVLVQKNGRLVGVVTRADLMPAIFDALEEMANARRESWLRTGARETRH